MKSTVLIAALCIGAAPVVSTHALASTAQSTTRYVTVDGEVVRYEAGKVIVLRGADGREMVYTLPATVTVPSDVRVGRHVTLYTEPGEDGGTQLVTRVVTTTVTPEGNIKKTTEDTRTSPSGVTTKTTTTQITGTVQAYEPGRTLTITRADGTQAVYQITGASMLPGDLVVGRTVSIVPSANGELVIKTVTYTKPQR